MTVQTIALAASADDCDEKDDGTGLTSVGAVIRVLSHPTIPASRLNGAVRYQGLNTPAGATVLSATITGTTFIAQQPRCDISAHKTLAPQNFVDLASLTPANRPRTTASVEWDPGAPLGATATTPNLAAVVQEIIDQPGWAAGNPIVFILDAKAAAAVQLWWSAEDSGAGNGPDLTVSWSVPTGAAARRRRRYSGADDPLVLAR